MVDTMTGGFFETMARFGKKIWSGPLPSPGVLRFPPSELIDEGLDQRIERNSSYFSVRLNELFLSEAHKLWVTYDPLVYIAAEFVYGNDRKIVPCFLGPGTIATKQVKVPRGFVVQDVDLLGPYPFRGGRVSLTIILYRAKNEDYAARVLRFSEALSSAVGIPPNISLVEKVGESLLSSVETLLDMGDLIPVAGHRFDIDTSTTRGFRTFSGALIGHDVSPSAQFRLVDGRLTENGEPFRASDFVLYRVSGGPARNEDRTLPFFPLLNEAVNEALTGDDAGWKRAKATLLTMYRQMLASPDLTDAEANTLFEQYLSRVEAAKDRAIKLGPMSYDKSTSIEQIDKLDAATRRIDGL